MSNINVAVGDVVQLNPMLPKNPMFAGCMLTVTEVRSWGVQGYVQSLGENDRPGGQTYFQANWEEFELVGKAYWVVD